MRSIGSPLAVSISTGTWPATAAAGRARMRRQTSRPSMSGSIRSRITSPAGAAAGGSCSSGQAGLGVDRVRHAEAGALQVLAHHLRPGGHRLRSSGVAALRMVQAVNRQSRRRAILRTQAVPRPSGLGPRNPSHGRPGGKPAARVSPGCESSEGVVIIFLRDQLRGGRACASGNGVPAVPHVAHAPCLGGVHRAGLTRR